MTLHEKRTLPDGSRLYVWRRTKDWTWTPNGDEFCIVVARDRFDAIEARIDGSWTPREVMELDLLLAESKVIRNQTPERAPVEVRKPPAPTPKYRKAQRIVIQPRDEKREIAVPDDGPPKPPSKTDDAIKRMMGIQ